MGSKIKSVIDEEEKLLREELDPIVAPCGDASLFLQSSDDLEHLSEQLLKSDLQLNLQGTPDQFLARLAAAIVLACSIKPDLAKEGSSAV